MSASAEMIEKIATSYKPGSNDAALVLARWGGVVDWGVRFNGLLYHLELLQHFARRLAAAHQTEPMSFCPNQPLNWDLKSPQLLPSDKR